MKEGIEQAIAAENSEAIEKMRKIFIPKVILL